ncbi:MAG TPA: aminoacyl-tRNA hydrolase [Alphaproteobacteria bacterium]|jgi:PTH1 family peptidyl-tRNA hydrolase|nr:aminoacyl-tRNA hydrolase [Alphaproteobacteria bacterium]
MKLVIGLGNPGEAYKNTRHSVGYVVIDEIKNKNIIAAKTDTFMNDSGSFVKKQLAVHGSLSTDDLFIVHDDLDIPLGKFKIQFGRGPKDHNGILDIEEKLGTKNFWRVRIGIDNRPLDNKPMGEVYTLENFTPDEKEILEKVIKEICKKLATL